MIVPARIGLIGCGRAAERIYLPAFARVSAARLAAVADPSAERRRIVAGAAGVPGFAAADEMISGSRLDAVIVATPPETHRELAEAALGRGLAVLVEKPLASTLVDARHLARTATESRGPLIVGFNRRRLSAAERLRDILRGIEDADFLIDSEFHALPAVWDPVAGARDPLDDLASHHLDLFRFLTGSEIEAIDARRLDTGAIELRMRLGSRARGRCTVSQGLTSRERLTAREVKEIGTAAGAAGAAGAVRAAAADSSGRAWMLRPTSDRLTPVGGPLRTALDRTASISRRLRGRPDPMARSFAAQLEALVSCTRSAATPAPDVADGLAVVEAIETARSRLPG